MALKASEISEENIIQNTLSQEIIILNPYPKDIVYTLEYQDKFIESKFIFS